eukprot:1580715-Pyramimonas_sp.AAC.1
MSGWTPKWGVLLAVPPRWGRGSPRAAPPRRGVLLHLPLSSPILLPLPPSAVLPCSLLGASTLGLSAAPPAHPPSQSLQG